MQIRIDWPVLCWKCELLHCEESLVRYKSNKGLKNLYPIMLGLFVAYYKKHTAQWQKLTLII